MKKMTQEELQRVEDVVSRFEEVVDKIDTDEWKLEYELDPIEMCNKTLVKKVLVILFQHHKPYTEEVLTRAIGPFAFNILIKFHILEPWGGGTYYMNWNENNARSRHNCTLANLRDDLLPGSIFGLSVEDFIKVLEDYGSLIGVCL